MFTGSLYLLIWLKIEFKKIVFLTFPFCHSKMIPAVSLKTTEGNFHLLWTHCNTTVHLACLPSSLGPAEWSVYKSIRSVMYLISCRFPQVLIIKCTEISIFLQVLYCYILSIALKLEWLNLHYQSLHTFLCGRCLSLRINENQLERREGLVTFSLLSVVMIRMAILE